MRDRTTKRIPLAGLCALLVSGGCYGQTSRISGTTPDADADTVTDTRADPVTDTGSDGGADVAPDVTVDPEPDLPVCTEAPACPDGPEDGVLGRACLGDGACDAVTSARCATEIRDTFEGETYVTYPGGTCQLWTGGTLACDPVDDAGCPPGSHCIYAGVGYAGMELYGCIDACSPVDSSGELHDWACGCRKGYACDLNYRTCFTGCSNDRECCETWIDRDGDYDRDAGEVLFWPGCEMYCDGDDAEEMTDCRASYQCINPGTPGALIGDPCEHDHQCPADGICLNQTDPLTGEEYYPGGYCIRMGCQYTGRGCAADGGACMNTGSWEDPTGICLQPCHSERVPSDPDFECRVTPGQEHACFPVSSYAWIGTPPDGMDGYCMPGNFGAGTGALGASCDDEGDCASPMGLGTCQTYFGDAPFCTVSCSQPLAEDRGICGSAGAGGIATGLCGWNMCFAGCGSPGADLGDNGCDRADMACAPLSTFGTATYVVEGALKPPGFCMPACDSDLFCTTIFGTGSDCDPTSGVCS